MTIHNSIFQTLRRVIKESRCFENTNRVMVGLSGGVDSSVLLHQLCALRNQGGPEVVAVHVHHGVRREEADRDAQVAEKNARNHGCEFHVLCLTHKPGSQAEHVLRDMRLSGLERLAKEQHISRIALAHHLDDQAETVLLRLFGGSDLRGLGAIRVFRPPFWVHPLLDVSRKEILEEAEFCQIPFVQDSTNLKTHMRRNFLRKNLIPLLKSQVNPQLPVHLARLAESMSQVNEFMELEAGKLLSESCLENGGLEVEKLRKASEALRNVALQLAYQKQAGKGTAMRRVQLAAINQLIQTEGAVRTYRLPRNVLAVRYANQFEFRKMD